MSHVRQIEFDFGNKSVAIREGIVNNGKLVHVRENNEESQINLEDNRERFNKQCQLVFDLLKSGKRLTRRGAYQYGIASLERRVKDLRENGVMIQTEWVQIEGKNSHKEYFM